MAEALHVCKYIVYLGETGFPYGLAPIQRQILISLGLEEAGAQVLVISHKGVYSPLKSYDLVPKGNYRGIDYVYTSGEIYRKDHFFQRNFLKLKGFINELYLLTKLKRIREIDAAIVATMRFQSIFYYYLLSRILSFKVLLNYVECASSIRTRTKLRDRINDYLVDRIGVCCADAVLPISEYLKHSVKKTCPKSPQLKIPILGDFKTSISDKPAQPGYFLYCGSANYLELIDFIVQAFEKIENQDVLLYLVVSGDTEDMVKFRSRIEASSKHRYIRTFSGIDFEDLLQKYRQAVALLIPLRNTIQDAARFPHKIGEYLASGVPIITTKYGEIGHYFTDGENAIISNNYDLQEYADKMKYVLEYPDEARKIGENGRAMGKRLFDYRKHGVSLLNFIQSLQ